MSRRPAKLRTNEIRRLRRLLAAMRDGDTTQFRVDTGICLGVEHVAGESGKDWFRAAVKHWPEYSGSYLYPVPATEKFLFKYRCPITAAREQYSSCYDDALWQGEYGSARKRLASFLLNALQNPQYTQEIPS